VFNADAITAEYYFFNFQALTMMPLGHVILSMRRSFSWDAYMKGNNLIFLTVSHPRVGTVTWPFVYWEQLTEDQYKHQLLRHQEYASCAPCVLVALMIYYVYSPASNFSPRWRSYLAVDSICCNDSPGVIIVTRCLD